MTTFKDLNFTNSPIYGTVKNISYGKLSCLLTKGSVDEFLHDRHFQGDIILERQKEGIKLAAAQGKYKGLVNKLKPDQAKALRLAWKNGGNIHRR